MSPEPKPPRMLATLAASLRDSGMNHEFSADAVPEPQAGRDLEGQRVLDRLRHRMFGVDTGPTRIGRWQLLGKLGKGAMGTVYAAHDPELDRRVAIKVLHGMAPDAEHIRRERLRNEAQAMARAQHPNLVAVHDVCVDAPQPYIVMELIDGETLRVWQARPERAWRELVQAYLEAAHGLAALHSVQIFHRDFKPDNALRDTQGHTRVVDFGLVSAIPSGTDPGSSHHSRLTREGALVGTLAYMSPEQLRGGCGDARSDQFSLCRSLFEAVYRVRPFTSNDPELLLAEIRDGATRPENPLGAPRRLFATLCRGLAYAPERRFPDMSALAAALQRCLTRPLAWTACLIATPITLGLALALGLLPHERSPCDAPEQLVDAWDSSQEAAIGAVFAAQGVPGALEQWESLNSSMHGVRAGWISQREETCRARDHAQPPAWAIQRDRCLDELRSLIKSLARTYISPTPTDIAGAREAAASLEQRLLDCKRIDPQHITPPPPDVTPRLTSALAQVLSEQIAGRLRRAEEAARRALDIAVQSGVPAAAAEAQYTLGQVLGHQRRPASALAMLDMAAREAARASHDTVRIDALIFAAKVRILDLGALDSATRDADDADDFIARLAAQGLDTARQTAELHEVRGLLAARRDKLDDALAHFGEALQLHRQLAETGATRLHGPCQDAGYAITLADSDGLPALRTLHNLTLALDDLDTPGIDTCVEALYRDLLAISEARLGPLGPLPLDIRFNLATHLRDAERDTDALAVLSNSTVATRVQYDDRSLPVAEVLLLLGALALDAQDLETSRRWSREAGERFAEACTPNDGCPANYGVALNLQGEHARRTKDLASAAEFYRAAITAFAANPEQRADNMLYLAEALADLGDTAQARDWLVQAAELFERQGREADPGLLALQTRLRDDISPQ